MDFSLRTLFRAMILCAFLFSSYGSIANQHRSNKILENLKHLDNYLNTHHTKNDKQNALKLANTIINTRQKYNATDIAKAYLLLADITLAKGDIIQAFQFAQDGLALTIQPLEIRLELLLITVQGYYEQGKFQRVKAIAERILSFVEHENEKYVSYRLRALGYRGMVYALISDYPNALTDLRQIDFLLEQHTDLAEQIDLLGIISTAYYYLGDYDTAIAIRLKLLNLNYENADASKLGEHHYALATTYQKLNRLDDAYNAFWQAKMQAEKTNSPIKLAYASLGLGQILYLQKAYKSALDYLKEAEVVFDEKSLTKAYLSNTIALIKVHQALNNNAQADIYLKRAENILNYTDLTNDQIALYQLLSRYYIRQQQPEKAWQLLNQYITLYSLSEKKRNSFLDELFTVKKERSNNHKATLQLVLKTELQAEYAEKFKKKNQLTSTLILIIIGLTSAILFLILKQRNQDINDNDTSNNFVNSYFPDARETKQLYQKSYKMARKYNYPLSIGYLLIHNWNDLKYQCNKKELAEVQRTIATVINEYMGEFDQAGLLNEGEYILLFPHQSVNQIQQLVSALNDALKVRFFANLGEVIVNISYAVDNLNVQDIDPFIFLSHLTESIRYNS